MRSMKKTGVVRLMVAVLDANCIPDDADILVDDCLYEIFFNVDQVVSDNNEEPDEFDEDGDLDPENKNNEKDNEMEGVEKTKNNGSNVSGSEASISNLQADQTSKSDAPNAVEKQVVDQAVVDKFLDELGATEVAASASDSKMVSTNVPDLLTVHDKDVVVQQEHTEAKGPYIAPCE